MRGKREGFVIEAKGSKVVNSERIEKCPLNFVAWRERSCITSVKPKERCRSHVGLSLGMSGRGGNRGSDYLTSLEKFVVVR